VCGRYTLAPGALTLFGERFAVAAPPGEAAGYNVPPGRNVAAIVQRADSAPSCEMFHWGLIPAWSQSSERQYKMINARVETVSEKRAYSGLLEQHRCLIPADGFFEWQPQAEGPKQPWWFHLPDAQLFAFAGLWTSWQPQPDVEAVDSCTILTTAANAVVAPVHGRMPLIVSRADEAAWLQPTVPAAQAIELLARSANDQLLSQAVSRGVNSTRNQGPECIEAIDPGGPDLGTGALF
jgi:putative SOS response-associated peptidase YedK